MKWLTSIIFLIQSLLGIQQVQMPSQPIIHHIPIEKPKASPVMGGTVDITATTLSLPTFSIPITATSSLDIVASKLSVIPSVSISGNTVSVSASGMYDVCTLFINQYNPISFNTGYYQKSFNITKTPLPITLPSGSYPFTFSCSMTGKQPGQIKSTITIP